MKELKIYIDSVEKVKEFINIVSKVDAILDVVSGRYVVDGKSIMGLFSLDLSKEITLKIHAEEKEIKLLETKLSKFLA